MGACLSSDVNGSSAMSPAEARALAAEQQKSKDLEASLQKVPLRAPLFQICPSRISVFPRYPPLSFSLCRLCIPCLDLLSSLLVCPAFVNYFPSSFVCSCGSVPLDFDFSLTRSPVCSALSLRCSALLSLRAPSATRGSKQHYQDPLSRRRRVGQIDAGQADEPALWHWLPARAVRKVQGRPARERDRGDEGARLDSTILIL